MKVLVTGVGGQLGFDVIGELTKRGHEAIGSDIKPYCDLPIKPNCKYLPFDIANSEEVRNIFALLKVDAIIHCAAWTNVDSAELKENRSLVEQINVYGTKNLVAIAKKLDCKFVYISTDYVFDGKGIKPWEPDDKDYAPLNYYGQTKLEGELCVSSQLDKFFIVRIAWVFGLNGNNFVKTMLSLYDRGLTQIKVVDDQIGTPTYTFDLARLLVDMIETNRYGYYHATNEGGFISWADFAEEIFKQTNKNMEIRRVTTDQYGLSIAKRPFNSRLNKNKLVENGFNPLPDWKDALSRYLKNI